MSKRALGLGEKKSENGKHLKKKDVKSGESGLTAQRQKSKLE